jgi:hypothetical protein
LRLVIWLLGHPNQLTVSEQAQELVIEQENPQKSLKHLHNNELTDLTKESTDQPFIQFSHSTSKSLSGLTQLSHAIASPELG